MFTHISTEALVCALVLSEEGNLPRAGARLHTSKSNVSRKVKTLQKSWGVELFQRTLTGFELTEQGHSSIRDIREAIKHIQRGFDHAIYTAVKTRRPLRIGHSLYVHERVLPFLQQKHPSGSEFSRIILKADTTVHLKARVLRGELNVGFGVMPIRTLAEKVWTASRNNTRAARTVVLKLKTKEFSTLTRSHTPAAPPSTCDEFTEVALSLCERVELGPQQLYRLVGVGLSNFQAGEDAPSPLFEESSAPLQMVYNRMQERGMDDGHQGLVH